MLLVLENENKQTGVIREGKQNKNRIKSLEQTMNSFLATKKSKEEKKQILLKLLRCDICDLVFSLSKDREEHAQNR